MRRLTLLLVLLAALLAATPSAGAQTCSYGGAYPGDDAPKAAIARWMAGLSERGLPPELPVMAALAESELRNLPPGDSDSAGYFQMRTSFWDKGEYAGYPDQPEKQLDWFGDQAVKVREKRIADGQGDPAADETRWGDWVADVQRPAPENRGRYQPRLGEARELLAGACAGEPPPPQEPAPQPAPPSPPTGGSTPDGAAPADTAPPTATVVAQPGPVLRRGALVVRVGCPDEGCTASAAATLSVPGAARVFRLRAAGRAIAAGATARLRLKLGPLTRAAVRRALRRGDRVRAKVTVTVADLAGNRSVVTRTVRVTR